jgi:hypothetical protein
MTAARERYEAKKTEEARRRAERQEVGKWWFRQRNPIDRFTGWLVVWTALLTLATGLSAFVLYKTDHTLRRTVVATQRPWIKASVEASGIRFTPEGGLIQSFKVTLKNVGNSVATFVTNDLKWAAVKDHADFPNYNELCATQTNYAEHHKSAVAIFPTEDSESFYSLFLSNSTITNKALGIPPHLLDLALVGCVAYRSEFGEETHSTGYVFSDRQKTHVAVPFLSGRLFEVGKDVPREEIELDGGSAFAR